MEAALFEKQYHYGNEPIHDLSAVRFNVAVIAYEDCHGIRPQIIRSWDGLTFTQLSKYQWFFRYVAAKHQTQNPKKVMYISQYRIVIADIKQQAARDLQNKIINLKGRITKDLNNLEKARAAWNSLFPIESDPQYQKALQVIQEKEARLKSLEYQARYSATTTP